MVSAKAWLTTSMV